MSFEAAAADDRRHGTRPLCVAVLAPRYHPAIVGGSEIYLRALCEGMAARGAAVEVVTTRSMAVEFDGSDAVRWRSQTPLAEPPGPVAVRRCATREPSPGAKRRLRRLMASALADAARRAPLASDGRRYLAGGFYPLERWGGERPFRWTAASARLELGSEQVESIRLEIHAMQRVQVELLADGESHARVTVEPGAWRRVELRLPDSSPRAIELLTSPVLRPVGDARTLGVAVGGIVCVTAAGEESLPLEHDEQWLQDELPTAALSAQLESRARRMPWHAGFADARLKGPWGAALATAALRSAARADVVLATNAPYSTLALGWLCARLTRRPFVALPFFHLRDPFHHRPQVRSALRRADTVFCLGATTQRFVERNWGTTAVVLGAGVDPQEVGRPGISGERFRGRHGLGDERIVLQVGRKTPAKGYRLTAAAVAQLAARGRPVRFVLVGPEEDGEPLTTPATLYLGKVDRVELLDALAACDVFALPSINESFGLAYLEAWMFGKPVIGHARCDAARDLIRPGDNGELVSDVAELTTVLARLLDAPEVGFAMGERGRAETARLHTWGAVVERALGAMNALVAGKG